jgi:hypothetical protein
MSEQVEMEEEDRRVSSATKEQGNDKKRFEVKKVFWFKVVFIKFNHKLRHSLLSSSGMQLRYGLGVRVSLFSLPIICHKK